MNKKIIFFIIFSLIGVMMIRFGNAQLFQAIDFPLAKNQLELLTSSTLVSSTDNVPLKNLKLGMRHEEVKKLQKILKDLGFMPNNLSENDFFGQQTRSAVIKFQKSQGLPATGFFDEKTRDALRDYLNKKLEIKKQKLENLQKKTILNEFWANLTSTLDKTVSSTCMKSAVEKRENSLLLGWENYASKVKTAHETRKNEILSAWQISDARQRQEAIKTVWEKYRKIITEAKVEWNQLKKNAWLTFYQESKKCRALFVEPEEIEEVE
ncbi:MAG: hypothetical protein KatS3mg095_0559 [Candidatus Parcubacteria bacterium]|nr:MAG: hypothetical protein KatS3mg095_0559 [Candidatus Parcubacteria bacterium]